MTDKPYVDLAVIVVPKAKSDAYRKVAELSAEVYRDSGALQVLEGKADNLPPGMVASFPRAVDLQDDEELWFEIIFWTSREDRNRLVENYRNDPRVQAFYKDLANQPFDGKRSFFGGFPTVVKF